MASSASPTVPSSTGNRHTPSSTAWPSSSQSISAPDSPTSSASKRLVAVAGAVRGEAHEVCMAAWSSVVEHRLEHRPHPVEQRVGPCGFEAGSSSISRKPSACSAPRAARSPRCGPSPPTGVGRTTPPAAGPGGRGPVELLGERRDREVAVLAGELDDGADRPAAVERGPVGVEDAPRSRPRPASTNSKAFEVGRDQLGSARAAWPRPRAAGRRRRTARRPGGSAARSSSWSVTLVLDGSATSATRPPGVGARVGRSAARAAIEGEEPTEGRPARLPRVMPGGSPSSSARPDMTEPTLDRGRSSAGASGCCGGRSAPILSPSPCPSPAPPCSPPCRWCHDRAGAG